MSRRKTTNRVKDPYTTVPGFVLDIQNVLRAWYIEQAESGLSYPVFRGVWEAHQMHNIFATRFLALSETGFVKLLYAASLDEILRLGAVYAVYTIFFTQPDPNEGLKVPVPMTPALWNLIRLLLEKVPSPPPLPRAVPAVPPPGPASVALSAVPPDFAAVVARLVRSDALEFHAVVELLYPPALWPLPELDLPEALLSSLEPVKHRVEEIKAQHAEYMEAKKSLPASAAVDVLDENAPASLDSVLSPPRPNAAQVASQEQLEATSEYPETLFDDLENDKDSMDMD